MKFKPIVPDGLSDRELLEKAVLGINDVHTCVDSFRTSQERVNAEAARKRHAMAGALAEVKDQQAIDGARITRLAKRLGAEKPEKGERLRTSWRGQPKWKIATTVFGSVSGVVLLIQIIAPAVVAGAQAFWTSLMAAH